MNNTLINLIQMDMSTMSANSCLDCKCYDVCQEVSGETMCGTLRLYYNYYEK